MGGGESRKSHGEKKDRNISLFPWHNVDAPSSLAKKKGLPPFFLSVCPSTFLLLFPIQARSAVTHTFKSTHAVFTGVAGSLYRRRWDGTLAFSAVQKGEDVICLLFFASRTIHTNARTTMPRPAAAALCCLLAAAAAIAPARSAANHPHVAHATAPPLTGGTVTCYLNDTTHSLHAVTMRRPPLGAPLPSNVVQKVVLTAPVPRVAVGVDDAGTVVSLRFGEQPGALRCGYWDPAKEVVVEGAGGGLLVDVDGDAGDGRRLVAQDVRLTFGAAASHDATTQQPHAAFSRKGRRRRGGVV